MKVVSVQQAKSDTNAVRDVLQEAIDENFTSVMVVGFKDGQVMFRRSKLDNTIEFLGAIEAAKMQLWEST